MTYERTYHMSEIYNKLLKSKDCIRKITDFVPSIGIILGSGLGGFADILKMEVTVPYGDIEGFPVSTVSGHEGKFIFGYLEDVPVICMQGRVHYYEGYSMSDVVMPVRLMKLLGAKAVILTNASGGINKNFKAGDLMLIKDHISSFVPSPLIGANIDELGTRFPDMSNIYDKELSKVIEDTAKELSIDLKEGVYVQTSGPNYESPAEIKMYSVLGADAVGMSTACEAIAANHAGLRICGISCISNLAAGISDKPLSHEEVKETADKTAPLFRALIEKSIINISKVL